MRNQYRIAGTGTLIALQNFIPRPIFAFGNKTLRVVKLKINAEMRYFAEKTGISFQTLHIFVSFFGPKFKYSQINFEKAEKFMFTIFKYRYLNLPNLTYGTYPSYSSNNKIKKKI